MSGIVAMMCGGLLADGTQLIGVLLIVAGAVGYLTAYYRRVIKGERGGCGCGCGIPLKRRKNETTQERSADAQQFVPVENLADLAARRREQLAEAGNSARDREPNSARDSEPPSPDESN